MGRKFLHQVWPSPHKHSYPNLRLLKASMRPAWIPSASECICCGDLVWPSLVLRVRRHRDVEDAPTMRRRGFAGRANETFINALTQKAVCVRLWSFHANITRKTQRAPKRVCQAVSFTHRRLTAWQRAPPSFPVRRLLRGSNSAAARGHVKSRRQDAYPCSTYPYPALCHPQRPLPGDYKLPHGARP